MSKELEIFKNDEFGELGVIDVGGKIINGWREYPRFQPWDESPLFLFFSYFCYIIYI